VLVGLLNGIVSLLDNDNKPEGPDTGGEDPEDTDPEGEYTYPGGEDPDGNRPDKYHKGDYYPNKDDSEQDSPPTKRGDKGKGLVRLKLYQIHL
jgi:hypothetical protein